MTETLQNRINALPPLMKWQFNIQLEKECKEKEFVSKDDLNRLTTDVENASTIMNHLLASNESANSMHRYLKHFDRPNNMKKTMEILISALKGGDEIIFRFYYLAYKKGISLTDGNVCYQSIEHPGLIQDNEEFKKWLPLMSSPELENFDSQNPQHMAPYVEWTKTGRGQAFQKQRANYVQAIQWYEADYCPVSHNNSKKPSQIKTLQRDS